MSIEIARCLNFAFILIGSVEESQIYWHRPQASIGKHNFRDHRFEIPRRAYFGMNVQIKNMTGVRKQHHRSPRNRIAIPLLGLSAKVQKRSYLILIPFFQ
jgi:hypothetical protein